MSRKELSPERRLMLQTLIELDGISEYSAGLSFKRGNISWAKLRKLVDVRGFVNRYDELYVTEAGRALIGAADETRLRMASAADRASDARGRIVASMEADHDAPGKQQNRRLRK